MAQKCRFSQDREGVSYRTVWNLFKRIAAKKVRKHCPVIRLFKNDRLPRQALDKRNERELEQKGEWFPQLCAGPERR
jgi:hypothetical protein